MKTLLLVLLTCAYLYPQAGNTLPRRIDTLETDVDSLYTYWVNIQEDQTIKGEKTFSNSKTVFSGDSVGIRGDLDVDGSITMGGDTVISLPDTTGITTGYVPKKQADGTILWQDLSAGVGSDSTQCTTGQLWYNSTTGAIHRKF